jgi:hypothetical protein
MIYTIKGAMNYPESAYTMTSTHNRKEALKKAYEMSLQGMNVELFDQLGKLIPQQDDK